MSCYEDGLFDDDLGEFTYEGSLNCCGLEELVGFSDINDIKLAISFVKHRAQSRKTTYMVYDWLKKKHIQKTTTTPGYNPAHIIFSDTNKRSVRGPAYSGGLKFAAYIRKHKLGKVYGTKPQHNPNSGNLVRAWIWTPDWPAIKKHKI